MIASGICIAQFLVLLLCVLPYERAWICSTDNFDSSIALSMMWFRRVNPWVYRCMAARLSRRHLWSVLIRSLWFQFLLSSPLPLFLKFSDQMTIIFKVASWLPCVVIMRPPFPFAEIVHSTTFPSSIHNLFNLVFPIIIVGRWVVKLILKFPDQIRTV